MKKNAIWMLFATLLIVLPACQPTSEKQSESQKNGYPRGTFGYDVEFLTAHQQTIILKDGQSRIAVLPAYQGRVMTSTAEGMEGQSFGWINYELIQAGEPVPQFNNYGGEERFWLGPEGGQYALYFAPGVSFTFENWQVPAPIDSEPFELVSHTDQEAVFVKETELQNYSYFRFKLRIDRTIRLLNREAVGSLLRMRVPEDLALVGYESENTITNTGELAWNKKDGLLSIWILGQFISSPANTVVVPFTPGTEEELGPMVNDQYFGKIGKNRLAVRDSVIFFKADGMERGKIGLSPLRAKDYLASYDAAGQILTLVFFNKPDRHQGYVNSMWELQEKPYDGDVINSYNDGPLDDGSQLGPFYELETSSPAAALKPGDSLSHISQTIHLSGAPEALEPITLSLFRLTVEEITQALNK